MAKLMPATNGGFPLENVNPAQKREKAWLLQYCRAAMGTYNNLPDKAIGNRSADRYNQIRAYAHAMQPIDQYFSLLAPDPDNDENGFNSLLVPRRITSAIPKTRRIALNLIKNANENYDITINPIDPQAASEMEDEAAEIKAKVLLRQSLQGIGAGQLTNAPAVAKQPGEPDDLDGAEVAVMGMRHKAAMKAELVVKQILNSNKYPDLREQIAADLFDYGVAGVKDDTSGCMVTLRHVDMRGLIISNCTRPDLSDARHIGEVHNVPVSEVIVASDGQITKEEMEQIFNTSASGSGVFYGTYSGWNQCYQQGTVQVLDLEIKTVDIDVREERKNEYGNTIFSKVKAHPGEADDEPVKEPGDRKIRAKKVQNIYRIKWIVGTDICYDFGLQRNVKLDPKNQARAQFSYHIIAGDIHDMVAYSRTESLIPFADAIQLRRMKLEHLFNSAVPNGSLIDLSALEEVAIGAGGKVLSSREVYTLYRTHGDLIYRSDSLVGDKEMAPPIRPLTNSQAEMIAEFWNDIVRQTEMMNQTIGLNEVTDASAADPKRLNVATNAAITGTNNAMSDLFSADRKITIYVSESCIIRAQDMFRDGKGKDFISALGPSTVNFLKSAPNIERYRFGVMIEDRPTLEQTQAFEAELANAVASGQLDIADVAVVRSMQNLKQRQQYLVYKVRKNREEAQAFELQKTKQLTDGQIQSAQATSEARIRELQVEWELRMQAERESKAMEQENIKISKTFDLEKERISGTGRVTASYVQGQAKDAASIRTAQTDLIKEGKEDLAREINVPARLETDIEPLTSEEDPTLPGIEELSGFSFLDKSGQQQPPMQQGPVPPMGMEQMPQEGMPEMDEQQMMEMMAAQ